MKIKKLILEKFRGYKEKTEITFEDLTALIGRNDAGKSTVLEALDIFFNEGKGSIKPDVSDCNVHSNSNEFKIGVVFTELPNKVVIDSSVETSLKDEYLINRDGDLEIIKSFKNAKIDKIEIICEYPLESQVPMLHNKKIKDLQKLAEVSGVTVDDNRISSSLRKAIFEYNQPLDLKETSISIKEEGTKQIWESIQKFIPAFSLFQSDRKNEDKDNEVQDPMKAAIKEILTDTSISTMLDTIFEEVKKATTEVAKLTIEKLSEMNPEIASELKPDFQKPAWEKIFNCGLDSDLNIPLNKRGSGVRRLVLLNFFRAKVEKEKTKKGNTNVIYAFEEPETALHPDHQKMLINSFIELSDNDNTQIIFTTHSPEIAKMVHVNSLRLIEKDTIGTQIVSPSDDILEKIVNTLGVFPTIELKDVNKVKVAVCVEGKNDIDFLMNINNVIEGYNQLVDLNSDEIIILPLGGSTLKYWVNNSYLSKLNLAQVHIYDSDIGSKNPNKYTKYVTELNAKANCKAFETTHREMENYITPAVMKSLNGFNECGIQIYDWKTFDVPEAFAQYNHLKSESEKTWDELTDEKKKKKISVAKRRINAEISELITKEHLLQYDVYEEVEQWFKAIKSFL